MEAGMLLGVEAETTSRTGSRLVRDKPVERRTGVVIRIAGDSGDGMQLTGDRFTAETAWFGNDVSTLPSFPAEIRAPAGTLAGVSSFQLQFADHDVLTPGDRPDVLVAMNPAALRANIADLPRGAELIVNTDEFTSRSCARAGWPANPLEDGSLEAYRLHPLQLTTRTVEALDGSGLGKKDAQRAKNMYALGLLSWMYQRPTQGTITFLQRKFADRPELAAANVAALRAGYNFGETAEMFAVAYEIQPAPMPAGEYRNITGNKALAYGLLAAAHCTGLPLFLGAYPITPASDVLHELAKHKDLGVSTFQAEDEIAAVAAALGASYGGLLGVTTTSGPGVALKTETIGLGVMLELPLVVVAVQRGGPSTGLPTKTEQADLLQAVFGRNGESPVPVLAPRSAADCFDTAIEAAQIATRYRVPVIVLSDGYLANGSEPWLVPDVGSLPVAPVDFATKPNHVREDGTEEFWPYVRDPETLARAWALPGTAGLEHRIGGLEKEDGSGAVSYDPSNHELMVRLRQAKVDRVTAGIAPLVVDDPSAQAGLLVVGWGSTYGPVAAACRALRTEGSAVAHLHLRHLNPLPADLGDVLSRYDKVLVPEMNLGQLSRLIRDRFLVDVVSHTKVAGTPLAVNELCDAIRELLPR
jgi:2-oxoglutarate ferredoxin oxidoreductase subunit alpha